MLSTLLATALVLAMMVLPSRFVLADGAPQARLPSIDISINDVKLRVEVAAQSQHRYKGLSYRESLGTDDGMLFVYRHEQPLFFTMRETLIPLSIAFISEDLIITEILDMTPGAKQNYPSRQPAKFALEVNSGWFAKHGIAAGAKIILHQP